jgi:hypothetical protein
VGEVICHSPWSLIHGAEIRGRAWDLPNWRSLETVTMR